LTFVSDSNENATPYNVFNYSVQDSTSTWSLASAAMTINVNPVNDAPSASSPVITLATIQEDSTPAGDTVSSIFSASYSDVDLDSFAGVAVVLNSASASNGVWQYQINGAGAWIDISTSLSNSSSFILAAADKVRFLPAANFSGTPGGLATRLWDGTSGSAHNLVDTAGGGGTTAFSLVTEVLGISVDSVNDAPVLNIPGAVSSITAAEGVGYAINGISITDVDSAESGVTTNNRLVLQTSNGEGGITLASVSGLTFVTGTNGSSHIEVQGSLADINNAIASITYLNAVDAPNLSETISIQYFDQGNTGNSGGALSDSGSISVTVTPVNDAPVVTPTTGAFLYNEGDGAAVIDATISLADPEGDLIEGASVQISSNYVEGQDYLNFVNEAGDGIDDSITVTWDPTIALLQLSSATPLSASDYQAALRAVTYQNTSGTPSENVRNVVFSALDNNNVYSAANGDQTGSGSVALSVKNDTANSQDFALVNPVPPLPSTEDGGDGDAGEGDAGAESSAAASEAGNSGESAVTGQAEQGATDYSTSDNDTANNDNDNGGNDGSDSDGDQGIQDLAADVEGATPLEVIERATDALDNTAQIIDVLDGFNNDMPAAKVIDNLSSELSALKDQVSEASTQLFQAYSAATTSVGEVEGLVTAEINARTVDLTDLVRELDVMNRVADKVADIVKERPDITADELEALIKQLTAEIRNEMKARSTEVGKIMQEAAKAYLLEQREKAEAKK
ncbi:MAG: hypothetical protein JXR97_05915, partial [Planctomycetes bacterium]|nr:hypothetical protein [Planctomycetota bacterium]